MRPEVLQAPVQPASLRYIQSGLVQSCCTHTAVRTVDRDLDRKAFFVCVHYGHWLHLSFNNQVEPVWGCSCELNPARRDLETHMQH